MLAELPATTLPSYGDRFRTAPAQLAAAAIAAGNTDCRFWAAGDDTASAALLLWDRGNNILYIGAARDSVDDALRVLVDGELREAALADGLWRFGVRALDETAARLVPRVFGKLLRGERRDMFWQWPAGRAPQTTDVGLPGIQWAAVDRELFARVDIDGVDEVRHEVDWMWPSRERFFGHGLGQAALAGLELICWCTSEYVSLDRCGIGIATAEPYRGRGVATATAARFVQQALERGLTPCWECNADNVASARVAAKLGLELIDEHTTWLGGFSEQAAAG